MKRVGNTSEGHYFMRIRDFLLLNSSVGSPHVLHADVRFEHTRVSTRAFILQISFICLSFIHAHGQSLKFSWLFSPVKSNSTKL